MKYSTFVFSALAALAVFSGTRVRADNMASIAIAPATGAVTLTQRWGIGSGLAGFHFMAQDLSLGGGPTQFYSIKAGAIPAGGAATDGFFVYNAASVSYTHLTLPTNREV